MAASAPTPVAIYQVKPILKLPRTPMNDALDAVTAVALILCTYLLVEAWPHLPVQVPTHFAANGQADAWGSRATLWILPSAAAFIAALLTVLCRWPHRFNYAFAITMENAERQYQIAVALMHWLKLEIAALFSYLTWATVNVALGHASGLNGALMAITLAAIFGTVGAYLWQSYRAR